MVGRTVADVVPAIVDFSFRRFRVRFDRVAPEDHETNLNGFKTVVCSSSRTWHGPFSIQKNEIRTKKDRAS